MSFSRMGYCMVIWVMVKEGCLSGGLLRVFRVFRGWISAGNHETHGTHETGMKQLKLDSGLHFWL